ncbi:MAG: SHOCT domain-containing protein [Actinomycetia bacterium]|nr:SHOCT domain-containing protein [Actinomycetes bacterium]
MMFMGFFWLLFLFLIAAGVVYIIQSNTGSKNVFQLNKQEEKPMDILRTRYAKGEIDEKEFNRMKKELLE